MFARPKIVERWIKLIQQYVRISVNPLFRSRLELIKFEKFVTLLHVLIGYAGKPRKIGVVNRLSWFAIN